MVKSINPKKGDKTVADKTIYSCVNHDKKVHVIITVSHLTLRRPYYKLRIQGNWGGDSNDFTVDSKKGGLFEEFSKIGLAEFVGIPIEEFNWYITAPWIAFQNHGYNLIKI